MASATTGSIALSVRGQVVKQASCNDPANTSYGRLYGLAGYETTLYGFSRAGSIVTISETDGSGCLALATATSLWSGATVSPSAR
jgi:hypothetical protein